MRSQQFFITGMSCAACSATITGQVQKVPGVEKVNVSLIANKMSVDYDENKTDTDKIISAVVNAGYGASVSDSNNTKKNSFNSEWQKRKQNEINESKNMKRRLITSVILLVPLMYIAMGHMLALPMPDILTGTENAVVSAIAQLLITIVILYTNRKFFIRGSKALIKRHPNMDSLVAIGSFASFAYATFSLFCMAHAAGHGDFEKLQKYSHELYYESSAMIVTLVTVGKYLEARSKSKTSDALDKLVKLAPKTAVVIRSGEEITIPSEEVAENDIVVIKPGMVIPVDGTVTEGNGSVDQSAITGESIPVEKIPGDKVISATINQNGTFRFKASHVGENTTLAGIIRLVDDAGNSKAPIARLADKISGIFVPVVITIALITTIAWLISGHSFDFALSCGISVLVISCPCALGLATPVAIMAGTGKAAEYGILVKSAESLENLHSTDTIVLDKTGTITNGKPSVTDIILLDDSLTEEKFIMTASAIESGSEHPLASAVINKAKEIQIPMTPAENFTAYSGLGIMARYEGTQYFAGNLKFIKEKLTLNDENLKKAEEIINKLSALGKTPLIFSDDKNICGIIAVADTIRDTSRSALENFRKSGIKTIMLTGDNKATAEAVRKTLDIDETIAEVMPDEKEKHIRNLMENGRKVAMIGDGINDAPALIRANTGIAIGAGTDIAIDSADIVLMKNSLLDVSTAITLSKTVIRNIKTNLFWAFFYNIIGIPIAAGVLYPALGIKLNPMIGAAAMSLSSLCVVTNALRLRFFKDKSNISSPAEIQTENSKTMIVHGMMCGHCKNRVETALSALPQINSVNADFEKSRVFVTLNEEIDDKELINAITNAGYKFKKFI